MRAFVIDTKMKMILSAAIFLILPVCVMSQTAETDTLAAGGARDELIDVTDAGTNGHGERASDV